MTVEALTVAATLDPTTSTARTEPPRAASRPRGRGAQDVANR